MGVMGLMTLVGSVETVLVRCNTCLMKGEALLVRFNTCLSLMSKSNCECDSLPTGVVGLTTVSLICDGTCETDVVGLTTVSLI